MFIMFKKSDILPLVLALISTALIVTMGFVWLAKTNIIRFNAATNLNQDDSLNTSDAEDRESDSWSSPSATTDNSNSGFVMPYIVPQGTSVTINGSPKMAQINRLLSKSFHRQFPGTFVNVNADGNELGLDLLTSGEIDLAAIDRPLTEAEKAAGLAAMKISNSLPNKEANHELYYFYRQPPNSEVEAFLGYALSSEGQLAITAN